MNNSQFSTILAIVTGFVIIWLLADNEKKKQKLLELEKEIADNENLNLDIKKN